MEGRSGPTASEETTLFRRASEVPHKEGHQERSGEFAILSTTLRATFLTNDFAKSFDSKNSIGLLPFDLRCSEKCRSVSQIL